MKSCEFDLSVSRICSGHKAGLAIPRTSTLRKMLNPIGAMNRTNRLVVWKTELKRPIRL